MSDDTKKVALPAYLLRRLQAFRIVSGDQTSYLLRDKLLSKTYDLEPWQFFLLEVLPGCDNYPKLASVFEDRFGRPISEAELRRFFAETADRKLFASEAESHPLLREFTRQGYDVVDGEARARDFTPPVSEPAATAAAGVSTGSEATARKAAEVTPAKAAEKLAKAEDADEAAADLPAGINDAVGFDPRTVRRMWVLFDPRPLLNVTLPLVRPLRALIYLIPVMVAMALMVFFQNPDAFRHDVEHMLGDVSFLQHLIFSMFTVNLLNTLLTAWTAHYYRATVSGIGIGLVFGFLPRFMPRVGHVKQLQRTEKMWLHAGPLLSRLFMASGGLLLWATTRDSQGLLPELALALAIIAALGLLLSANPLTRGSAYHLLAAFTNEPHLRGKAYKALLNRLHGKVYRQADAEILSAYAAATLLFSFVVIAVVLLLLAVWLSDLQLGGLAVVAVLVIGAVLTRRTWTRFGKIEASYERSQQFERWRRRAVPEEVVKGETVDAAPAGRRYLRIALLLVVVALMFLPYRYTPSGKFVVYPSQQVAVTSDIGGLITEVLSDGGERLPKGAPLARLATDDLQVEIDTLAARMREQEAVVADLRARPKPEAVEVARRALESARNQVAFSTDRAARLTSLHAVKAVTTEELEAARRQARQDVDAVALREAELALARIGATPEQIAAAEAALKALADQQAGVQQRVARSVLRMPIDGNVLSLRLGRRLNSYLPRGEVFAMVEDAKVMSLELELPESDLPYLREGADVEVRASALYDDVYRGEITLVDRNVTAQTFGNVVKVLVSVRNPDERLRTGMTGFAKVDAVTMPAWKAFSMSVLRFFQVHVWSWLP
ncbi:MAG: efflux RND transporter periplasmic adaptor subunit [Burkholderiaceae bacterium]|nr:efflux RND transporter periplasmic adaptor subunit [Rhodoferax sp.]MCP5286163.1 efflux RND transporter periplasmic adaptor subunit [Burkholderiaceae bacterium]